MKGDVTVKSDETLLSILDVIRNDGPVRLSAISGEVGVAKSTVHNHLQMLENRDFVTLTDDGYELGLRFLEFGQVSQNRREIFQQGQTKVEELADSTEELAWCVVEEHGQAVYIYKATGRHSIQTNERVGMRRQLHCIAAGKAILANLPEDRVEEIIATHGLDRKTEHTITDRDTLYDELEEIRNRGVAFNLEELITGLHAIAAPVLNTDGSVYGAISIGGPANRLTKSRLENELSDLIRGATNEIEINIREQQS